MKRFLHILFALVIFGLTFMVVPPAETGHANSAAPPSIIIIVPYAPEDLEITLMPDEVTARRTNRAFESYFTFYMTDLRYGDYTLRVTSGDTSYDKEFSFESKYYTNTWVLNFGSGKLTEGSPVSRSIMLISMRVLITLLIEGLVFWGFRYKEKRSWIIFLIINLLTQGVLNIVLDLSNNAGNSYVIFQLIFGEILVFLAEIPLFLIFIDEKRRAMTFLYVISANLLSLFAGGYLITVLPV